MSIETLTRIAILSPSCTARLRRLASVREAHRAVRVSGLRFPERALLVSLASATEGILDDPVLGRIRVDAARNWDSWISGESNELLLISRRGSRSEWRKMSPFRIPLDGYHPALSRRLEGRTPGLPSRLWLPRLETSMPPLAEALWISDERMGDAFDALSRIETLWTSARAFRVAGGWIVAGQFPILPLSCGLPLIRRVDGGGQIHFCELELRVPPGLRWSRPKLILVRRGRVTAQPVAQEGLPLSHLLASGARRHSSRHGDESIVVEDLRREETAVELENWLSSEFDEDDPGELSRDISLAFQENNLLDDAPIELHSKTETQDEGSGGWRRYFGLHKLGAALRRRLNAWSEYRLGRHRETILGERRKVLRRLLDTLGGDNWMTALSAAFPLRRPRGDELNSHWLVADSVIPNVDADFSLDHAASAAALGSFAVGGELYEKFRALYELAAERLFGARNFRQSAHVYSYLLGDHGKAAAVLEQGGHTREAATLYYHLADQPQKSAVALERSGNHEEAARIWMELRMWQRAAKAWGEIGASSQARAAWRNVVAHLRRRGRPLEAAAVLSRNLKQTEEALRLLEETALSLAPDVLEATRAVVELTIREDRPWPEKFLSLVGDAIFRDTETRPRRHAFKRSFAWTNFLLDAFEKPAQARMLRWTDIESAWNRALTCWVARRGSTQTTLRCEIDASALHVALRISTIESDPWLVPDLECWLRVPIQDRSLLDDEKPEKKLISECSAIELRNGVLFMGTGADIVAVRLAAASGNLVPGTGLADGGLVADGGEEIVERYSTLGSKPVTRLQASDEDLYCASGAEIHHFGLEHRGASPRRPAQVERSISGNVNHLAIFPDGGGLLRGSARYVHILHPVHLRPIEELFDAGDGSIMDLAVNQRHIAILVFRGRDAETTSSRFEILVYGRRPGTALRPRLTERFDIERLEPLQLTFYRTRSDDLLVRCAEHIAIYPSRRESASIFELEINAEGGDVPQNSVIAAPSRNSAFVAHRDGSLERIELESREREFVLGPLDGPVDPLMATCHRPRPLEIWLAHRSGRLRSYQA